MTPPVEAGSSNFKCFRQFNDVDFGVLLSSRTTLLLNLTTFEYSRIAPSYSPRAYSDCPASKFVFRVWGTGRNKLAPRPTPKTMIPSKAVMNVSLKTL